MPPGGARNRAAEQAAAAARGNAANAGAARDGGGAAPSAGAHRRGARERTGSTHEEYDGALGAPEDEREEGAGTAAVRAPGNNHLRLFELEGKVAGQHAADERRHGRPYSIEPSEEVKAAGFEARLAWVEAFEATFKSDAAQLDPVVGGLHACKKRRTTATVIPMVKEGRNGLELNGAKRMSDDVYAHVRAHLFVVDDGGMAVVKAALVADGFTFTPAEFDAWWSAVGHSQAARKFATARHDMCDQVKHAVFKEHGTCCLGCAPRSGN
jgi:hypothetical protein